MLRNNELQKVQDRYSITKQELDDDVEAKEDLIVTLEESLEEAQFQIKTLYEQLNEDGVKFQYEVQTLRDQK